VIHYYCFRHSVVARPALTPLGAYEGKSSVRVNLKNSLKSSVSSGASIDFFGA